MIKVKKLTDNAIIPTKANYNDAGFDLHSIETLLIPPLERVKIHTGISIEICENSVYARIAPRSGLAFKYGIDVLAGVIDAGYRGEIAVVLHNTDKESAYAVKQGDRIAQMIFEKYVNYEKLIESEDLGESNRSINGFGSSGIN